MRLLMMVLAIALLVEQRPSQQLVWEPISGSEYYMVCTYSTEVRPVGGEGCRFTDTTTFDINGFVGKWWLSIRACNKTWGCSHTPYSPLTCNTVTGCTYVAAPPDVPGRAVNIRVVPYEEPPVAIARDAVSIGGFGGSPLTWSHTVSGSDRILYVGFVWDPGNDDPSSVTYDSVAMTQIGKILTGGMNRYLYRLIAPNTGTHDVVVTTATGHTIFGGAGSYTGAHQTSQPASASTFLSTGTPTSLLSSLTPTVDNAWIVLWEGSYNGNAEPGAGTGATKIAADNAFGTWGLFDTNAAISPAASTDMTTTRSSTPDREIGHIMVEIRPVAVVGGSSVAKILEQHN